MHSHNDSFDPSKNDPILTDLYKRHVLLLHEKAIPSDDFAFLSTIIFPHFSQIMDDLKSPLQRSFATIVAGS